MARSRNILCLAQSLLSCALEVPVRMCLVYRCSQGMVEVTYQ